MGNKLSNPHCTAYVSIHNEVENTKFMQLMHLYGFVAHSDFGQVPERKWICDSCGEEVRDHDANKNCPE